VRHRVLLVGREEEEVALPLIRAPPVPEAVPADSEEVVKADEDKDNNSRKSQNKRSKDGFPSIKIC